MEIDRGGGREGGRGQVVCRVREGGVCVCVCVCECERERERAEGGPMLYLQFAMPCNIP